MPSERYPKQSSVADRSQGEDFPIGKNSAVINNAVGGFMAIDVYLQLDGIKGESTDVEHTGWIECTSAHWGVSQPKSATASTSGGHTAERCDIRSISLTKLADLASPLLMQSCAAGRTLKKARIIFLRADGQGSRVKYYEVELENVLIGSVNQSVHSGDILQDALSLKFSSVRWKYTQQRIGGGIGGNTAGGWDLSSNRIA